MEPAEIGKTIQLELGHVLGADRDIVTQFAKHERAAVAQKLGGVEGAAEDAAPIPALFGGKQRMNPIWPIGCEQGRELGEQRLIAGEGCLELGEIETRLGVERAERLGAR